MIYKNFLYFIIAVVAFVSAPVTSNDLLPVHLDILIIPALVFLFSIHVRSSFLKLKKKYPEDEDRHYLFRSEYTRTTNFLLIEAIVIFIIEMYVFDLKVIIMSVLKFGEITFAGDIGVLSVFILHFAIVWYWGFMTAGDISGMSVSAGKFVSENIKFNLAIMIPWLILVLSVDILKIFNIRWITESYGSPYLQLLFLAFFLLIFLVIGPVLIIKLWNCKPLSEGDLRTEILKFPQKEGVAFSKILSWDPLSGNLMTAGVLGYFPFVRYLLITPELMAILSTEEIIAVVSHETGHVKGKHILYYLLLFVGFAVLSGGIMNIVNLAILNSSLGIDILTGNTVVHGIDLFHILGGILSILMFILYFRYIFGYFMRNFEREADLYCFDSGVDPEKLISSFEKLGGGISEKKGSNWHHYSIGERIDFLKKCIRDRSEILKHKKKVRKSVLGYTIVLIVLFGLTVNPFVKNISNGIEQKVLIQAIEREIRKSPSDFRLYAAAAAIYHEKGDMEKAKNYYEISLSIKYEQPETLNNLAWLLVKSKDGSLRERKRSLRLAIDAVSLKSAAHIYDTLAEAFLINKKYKEAVQAAVKALDLADGDKSYFIGQLKKMKKNLGISGVTYRL